jgi:hypothetical protein
MEKTNVFQLNGREKTTELEFLETEKGLHEALEKFMNDYAGSKEDFLGTVADWLDQQAGYA